MFKCQVVLLLYSGLCKLKSGNYDKERIKSWNFTPRITTRYYLIFFLFSTLAASYRLARFYRNENFHSLFWNIYYWQVYLSGCPPVSASLLYLVTIIFCDRHDPCMCRLGGQLFCYQAGYLLHAYSIGAAFLGEMESRDDAGKQSERGRPTEVAIWRSLTRRSRNAPCSRRLSLCDSSFLQLGSFNSSPTEVDALLTSGLLQRKPWSLL